jgi:hypothetical protein
VVQFFFKFIWNKTPIIAGKFKVKRNLLKALSTFVFLTGFLDVTESCLSPNVAQYAKEAELFETSLWTSDSTYATIPRHYLAYVGNGKLGIPIEAYIDEPFYVMGKRSLDTSLPYYPLIEVELLSNSYKSKLLFESLIYDNMILISV